MKLTLQDSVLSACWGLRTAAKSLSLGELQDRVERALGIYLSPNVLSNAIGYSVRTGTVRNNGDGTFSWLGVFAAQPCERHILTSRS